MEQAWDDLVAVHPSCGIRFYNNVDPITGVITQSYGASCNTAQGQVVVEKNDAPSAVTILSGAVLGVADDEAMQTLVRRSELDQAERNAKRDFDRATFQAA